MQPEVKAMLLALGPGGTTELAERALAHALDTVVSEYSAVLVGDPLELGGVSEVAAELGESRQTVGHWIAGRRGPGNFPAPFTEISAGKIWDMNTIREWHDKCLVPWLESNKESSKV